MARSRRRIGSLVAVALYELLVAGIFAWITWLALSEVVGLSDPVAYVAAGMVMGTSPGRWMGRIELIRRYRR